MRTHTHTHPHTQGLLEMMYSRIDEWVNAFITDMQQIVPSLQQVSVILPSVSVILKKLKAPKFIEK
jgi:hypothetical protein